MPLSGGVYDYTFLSRSQQIGWVLSHPNRVRYELEIGFVLVTYPDLVSDKGISSDIPFLELFHEWMFMTFSTAFSEFLSEDDLQTIYDSSGELGRPPCWSTVFCDDKKVTYDRTKTDYQGSQSIHLILDAPGGRDWLEMHKNRLLPPSEYSEIASMMAEIRCYGALLEAGYLVEPIEKTETPTPDFKVKFHNPLDSEKQSRFFFVEVAAKLEDGAQTQITREIAKGNTPAGVSRSETVIGNRKLLTTVRQLHPFGTPNRNKPNDSVQANAISRFCSVKGSERQVPDNSTTILWIDLSEVDAMRGRGFIDHHVPLISGLRDGALTSGFAWYAFYGWKGAPIFEAVAHKRENRVVMGHEGRFKNPSNISKFCGAVICMEGHKVFFENPLAIYPLNENERFMLHGLPSFNLGKSIASWENQSASKVITEQKKMIEAIDRKKIRPAAGLYGELLAEEE